MNITNLPSPIESDLKMTVSKTPVGVGVRYVLTIAVWCITAASFSLAQTTDRLSVTQWVTPDDGGQITVRVVMPTLGGHGRPVADAEVRLLGGDGTSRDLTTDADGATAFSDVPAGVYAIVAQSSQGFACYAIHVVDSSDAAGKLYPSVATVACGMESKQQFSDAVDDYFPLDYELKQLKLDPTRLEGIVDHVRGNERFRVARVDESMIGYIYQSTDHGGAMDRQDQDGRLDPAERANVFLYQDGKRLRHQITDSLGRFQFKNLAAGIYSLISVGPDGIGAMGFELVDGLVVSQLGDAGEYQFVAKGYQQCGEFALQVVPCCEPVGVMQESCCQPVDCCEPVPCCEEVTAPAAVPTANVAAPVGGGAPIGGGGGAVGTPVGGVAAAGVITAALISNSNRDRPYEPPPAASPDTQRP